MVQKSLALVPLMFALGIAPALAKPTVIAELGTAPLLGTSTSTAEMRARVDHNASMMSAAAAKLGLTPNEYAQFRSDIDASRVAWVTVPRHLDAMSWSSGGQVYVLHDVQIPAATNGWEVDVRTSNGIAKLYMPAKCGNLSLLRTAAPVVAQHHVPTRVAALKVAPPPPPSAAPAPPAEVPAAPAPAPDDTPAAPPATVAAAEFPPVAAAAGHHALFLAPLLFGLAALAGGSGSGPVVAPPAGCP